MCSKIKRRNINVDKFMIPLNNDKHSRYLSYEHFHNSFGKAINDEKYDKDQLALELFAFLASWGMLRGSTFSLKKDYTLHLGIIDILMKDEYRRLLNYDNFNDDAKEAYVSLILQLKKEIVDYYMNEGFYYDKNNGQPTKIKRVSDVLVSKIMLASFGCIPVYDNYCTKSMHKYHIVAVISKRGLNDIFYFAQINIDQIRQLSVNISSDRRCNYPPMKIVDMALWSRK